ncbi:MULTISPECIES: hybrid sensor histidine kinase/response regulator [unclassified Tolypothrix]|uniref:hybrid sensor histidine kinase/response regulator n=1 Tax=unclassified Tolypothrix TaxID=2649714 RepID=UPI0005EABA8C|nr:MULTISPECIES: hybrid sensor histidine kinase/response regulator [unclassified Tolypothrix]BAY88456.1 CheA signal transduction histidine kinase [Microchaete diplosiphon NIES-3275]EKF02165.1 response regulator receiver domain protein [Tolypothrix sp. PCC 7601]MBE9081129.1 hybrid sensor histidine kinase/response regulator [Tolypothrix sp. LEGE 11397]UYD29136.1 hybrid sensor histidine kinase/response regulator [Tolypothrix sp. PCC 7712]UYD34951.1 hybrid sensor histidine kinase/response regulato
MTTDNDIREQGYIYFLAEAPELLQIIEQEIYTLSENFSTAKVHELMRATHTIKGGAANVGLEGIQTIAHSLEDVFNALYNPNVILDSQLQTLILQAYECLNLALTAELTGCDINTEELLQRAASVFVHLQEKLGDAFGGEAHIPTSAELGFDIVQSIFEVGVQQRIESITEALNSNIDITEIANLLREQAEIFIGLAESLNLPGFGAIAQTILAALTAKPEQAYHIAEAALANLQQAQAAVLAGDRTSGGEPSLALQSLANIATNESNTVTNIPISTKDLQTQIKQLYKFLITSGNLKNQPLTPAQAKFYIQVIRYIFGWFNHYRQIPQEDLSLSLLVAPADEELLTYIEHWLSQFLDFIQEAEDSQSLQLYRQGVIFTIILAVVRFYDSEQQVNGDKSIVSTLQQQIGKLAQVYKKYPPVTNQEKNWLDSPKLQQLLVFKEIASPTTEADNLLEKIWGGEVSLNSTYEIVETSESPEITQTVPETVIITSLAVQEPIVSDMTTATVDIHQEIEDKISANVQKNSRQHSFVRVDTDGLQRLNYLAGELLIKQKQRMLQDEQVREIIDQLVQRLNKQQSILGQLGDLPLQMQTAVLQHQQNFAPVKFDALEMDVYTEFQMTLHEAMEEALQLQEITESLDLLLTQANQLSEKKQRLTLNIIDNLVEARMSPLGNIMNRFPQMVKKMGNVYAKLVDFKLSGTDVLVDKAIAEKLYDPLLHLVRNAFDHGIETPQVRQSLGKPEQAVIEISAYHQGSQTVIEVRDDGQGINLEKIRQKAIEVNLLADVYNPTESEILDLMFAPGFSTAEQVNEISGRGMGLDIVRLQLHALNGSISVKSFPNQGTKFILKVPFSMTTDKLMLVQADGIFYALLLDNLEKILIPSEQQIKEFDGRKVLYYNTDQEQRMVSISRISELMYYHGPLLNNVNLNNTQTAYDTGITQEPVLLLRHNQEMFGLEVDQIIGEQELVIRPLGNAIAPPKYIYGCSSLANGTLILVIDPTLLLESDEMQATLESSTPSPTYLANKAALSLSSVNTNSTPLLAASPVSNTTPTQVNQLTLVNPKSSAVLLVVDDAISLRQTISLTLQKSGYQILQAQNGVEALEQLQRHPEIKVVISDLEMPRMNGFELLSNIRQSPNFSDLPIVILTSRSAEKHRQLAQALGATAYLTKPYLEETLISIVEDVSNKSQDKSNKLMMR